MISVGAFDGAEDRVEMLQRVKEVNELSIRDGLQTVLHVRRDNGRS